MTDEQPAPDSHTAAWFDRHDRVLVPRPHARAPWADDMLHGRYLAGLTAREIEAQHLEDGWFPARVTVDLFRSPPMGAVTLNANRIRDGGRVRVVDVNVFVDGREVARARVLVVRTADQPFDRVWSRPAWDLPHPDELGPPPGMDGEGEQAWQFRTEPDRFIESAGAARCWTRDVAQLVAGEEMSPFVRVATAADLASPLANSGPDGLDFINADITLSLARLPRSDWIGFETVTHEHEAGVSASSCVVHDLTGAIGLSTVSADVY